MRQSGPFEYLDLEEVVKWDYGSEVPGEDGGGGIPDTMGVRRKRRRGKVPEREGVWVQMAAGKAPEREDVRVQMAAGEGSGTRGCPGANAPEREGGQVQMAVRKAPECKGV